MSEKGELRETKQSGWIERLLAQFPPGQFGRYLVVGLFNSAFGYGTYAGLTALLTPRLPLPYVFAFIIAYFLNVTFSFLTYKWFIFKTGGGYLKEWWRCVVVYGGTNVLAVMLLPLIVYLVRQFTLADRSAPYVGGALEMGAIAVVSFLGHKNFTFRSTRAQDSAETGESTVKS